MTDIYHLTSVRTAIRWNRENLSSSFITSRFQMVGVNAYNHIDICMLSYTLFSIGVSAGCLEVERIISCSMLREIDFKTLFNFSRKKSNFWNVIADGETKRELFSRLNIKSNIVSKIMSRRSFTNLKKETTFFFLKCKLE